MTGSLIKSVQAAEILDSRGNPTLQVTMVLNDGSEGVACVPSGASTGQHEAVELRDRNPDRYGGLGVLQAVKNVETNLQHAIVGLSATRQSEIDLRLIEADGTPNKCRLGANAILGVSMAAARAAAASLRLPLYAYLGGLDAARLPVPMMNVINGGKHASNSLDFQEFMIVPHGAPTFTEAVRYGAETFHALAALLEAKGLPTTVGDEGGFAPSLEGNEAACELIVEAIAKAGFTPGKDIAIALDPAASSFYSDGHYTLSNGRHIKRDFLLRLYADWVDRYPIVSIEDGFNEGDWDGYIALNKQLGDRIQLVGDDNYVTNPIFIAKGIELDATNAVLIKLNQIGTITETAAAINLARGAGWRCVVSHRSGETEDTFIADFAVATGVGQIKAGSLSRSERVSKYNRLMAIERNLGDAAVFSSPFRLPDSP